MNVNKLIQTIVQKVIVNADQEDWVYESDNSFLTRNIYKRNVPKALQYIERVKDKSDKLPKKRGRPPKK